VESQEVNDQFGGPPRAVAAGLKIAVFDVKDVSQPREKFKTTIGDQGTYSELLDNHKALLFSREKKLLAFPVTVMKKRPFSPGQQPEPVWSDTEMEFQGAYVYSLDLTSGLNLKGKVTHLSSDAVKKPNFAVEESFFIKHLLYIDNSLYSLSAKMVKTHNLANFKEEASLVLK
jgi:hypothetical protein